MLFLNHSVLKLPLPTLAIRFGFFREAEGITQSSLAHQLGVSRQRLCDFEKARRYPSIPTAIRWATVLGHCPSIVIESLVKEQLERANVSIKTLKLTLDLS